MVGARSKLLRYLRATTPARYQALDRSASGCAR